MGKTEQIEKLQHLLRQLFQFENEDDRDAGIHRIINIKRKEVADFIEKDLFDITKQESQRLAEEDKKREGDNRVEEIEEEIYDAISEFFARYYDDGDFITKRRYSKKNKYIIPYNGEEVYFGWANSDQYYVKSQQNFLQYSFNLQDRTFQFNVIGKEVEGENANTDQQAAKDRYFIFSNLHHPSAKNFSLEFRFRRVTEEEGQEIKKETGEEKITQKIINKYYTNKILQQIAKIEPAAVQILQEKYKRKDGTESDLTNFEWHVNRYATKNTSDFFINKDLKGFLAQELDFYIKNEIVVINDEFTPEDLGQISRKVTLLKKIAGKIIEFLAQIENFQKKLWEKKKFIVATHYLITLDLVDEKYWPEIAKNSEQIKEWKAIAGADIQTQIQDQKPKAQDPVKRLTQHKTLMLNTRFFDEDFKYRVLSEIPELETKINGVLIRSDNFQALNLIQEKYREKIDMIYADPPYNTGNDGFLYKDQYKDATWLTMMSNLLEFFPKVLKADGTFFISIDNNEFGNLFKLLEENFGANTLAGPIIVQVNRGGRDYLPIALTHEYLLCGSMDQRFENFSEIDDEARMESMKCEDARGKFSTRELRNRNPKFNRKNRPNLFYPFWVDPQHPDEYHNCPVSLEQTAKHTIKVEPLNSLGVEGCWRWGKEKVIKNSNPESPVASEIVARQRKDQGWNIYEKSRKETTKAKGLWDEPEMRTENGSILLRHLFGKGNAVFDFPKPMELIRRCVEIGAKEGEYVLDFFAGSGTTGQAVIDLNHRDDGNRKFILIDLGKYFDTVLIPRIQKSVYSLNWKDGKPQDNNGVEKQIVKYQYLEQYEDTVNNLVFIPPNATAVGSKDYKIKYMLDFETRHNAQFLTTETFQNPFGLSIEVQKDYGKQTYNVDLIETFNYLYGIFVKAMKKITHNARTYLIITGSNGNGEGQKQILVIWRDISKDFDPKDDKEFIESTIIQNDTYDEILINGNSLVKNAKSLDGIFKRLMFE